MSKGSQVRMLRLPVEMERAVKQAMKSANRNRVEEPYTISSFIRHAIQEKLDKMARGRRPRRVKPEEGTVQGV